MTQTLVDDKAAAKFLGLAPQTLRNWRLQGRGPAVVHLGRSIRYDPKDLQEFVEERKVKHQNQ